MNQAYIRCKMRFPALVVILLCIWSFQAALASNDGCDKLLRELSQSQALFVQCATKHSMGNFCVGCVNFHENMINSFSLLIKTSNCSKEFLDTDRMNVVPTVENLLSGLWSKGNCDDCSANNHFSNFDKHLTSLSDCIDQHKGHECTNCASFYLEINTFYKKLEEANKRKVCYDIEEKMNLTRLNWSKDLKCCQREKKMTAFIGSAIVVAVIPLILFYVSVYTLTNRRERNHRLLNEQEPELDVPSTSTLITAAILARNETPAETQIVKLNRNLQQIGKHDLSTDSSGDESILGQVNAPQEINQGPLL